MKTFGFLGLLLWSGSIALAAEPGPAGLPRSAPEAQGVASPDLQSSSSRHSTSRSRGCTAWWSSATARSSSKAGGRLMPPRPRTRSTH